MALGGNAKGSKADLTPYPYDPYVNDVTIYNLTQGTGSGKNCAQNPDPILTIMDMIQKMEQLYNDHNALQSEDPL